MKTSLALVPAIFLASACVDVNINNQPATDAGPAGCSLGSANGGSRGDASGSDESTVRPPKATDSISIQGNIDQTALSLTWDPANPKTTSNFTTSMTVYNSIGRAIQLDIYFCKDDDGRVPGVSGDWTYHVMTDGANLQFQSDGISPTTPGSDTEIAEGTLRFDTSGRLMSNILTVQGFYPNDAVGPQVLTFHFGTGTDDGGSGLDGITQFAATSAVRFVTQSGWGYSY